MRATWSRSSQADPRITDRLTAEQLDDCFNIEHHMKGIDVPFERLGLLTA